MSKIIIICTHYDVISVTLYLVTHNYPDHSITIVVPEKHNLFKFFQAVNERMFHNSINLIFLEPYHTGRAASKGMIKKVVHIWPDIIKERRYLKEIFNKYFAELEGCEIFLPTRAPIGLLFYLLKKLSKRNKLVYISNDSPHVNQICTYIPTNINGLAYFIIRKLTYGLDIATGKIPVKEGFPCVPDKFMEKRVDRIIDWEEKNEMMKGFDLSQFKIFDTSNYSVIYLDQPLMGIRYVTDGDTYRRELTEIFNVLSKYFPEKEIARKYHPNHDSDKTMIKVGDILPDFIPAELLYNENVRMYLGFFSTSLAHVRTGLAVSLLDLISLKNDKTRSLLKEYITQESRSEILFPKSLDEFERILVNIVKD